MKPSEKMAIMLLAAASEITQKCRKPKCRARMLAAHAIRKWCPKLSYRRIGNAVGYTGHCGAIDAHKFLSATKNPAYTNQIAFIDEYVRNECMVLVRAINVATMANAKPLEARHAA